MFMPARSNTLSLMSKMSGNVSVVAFEGEINAVVLEYLDFSGFDKTKATFEDECSDKKKPIAQNLQPSLDNHRLELVQKQMVEYMDEGRGDLFFKLWNEYLLPDMKTENDQQKLVFYLNVYFAVYPVNHGQPQGVREEAMARFKMFLENKGSSLSQTPEFLPYYALPYVANPRTHPSYGHIFSDKWSGDLRETLKTFLATSLKNESQPRLFDIYKSSKNNGKVAGSLTGHPQHQQQLAMMSQQVVELEKKASSYLNRHNKIQSDYHNLISITADLVDALEATVQGRPVSPEYLQQLCNRLFTTHMRSSVDLSRPGTAGEILRASVAPPVIPVTEVETSYPPLDFNLIKDQLTEAPDRKRTLLLQALRWRLTRTRGHQRDGILREYIVNDVLGCSDPGLYHERMMMLLLNGPDTPRQYLARLYNTFASLCAGRGYLATDQALLPALMDILHGEKRDSTTQEMVLGTLQKLSLRRHLQSAMIDRGVIAWLIRVLEDNDSLSDYTLEYSVALLMNLCLRTAGKKKCISNTHQTLKVLSDLLGHENTEIRPYVNGALYSILAIPSIREEAKAMGMEDMLNCFIKEGQPDLNRQIEFIIKQLNSNDNGDNIESDDEDEDEDEEADQEALEADLDKDEVVQPQPQELVGERLLAQYTLLHPPSTASRSRKKLSGVEPLQRPSTPGSRRILELANHNVNNNNTARSTAKTDDKPAIFARLTATTGDIMRPPTRSGSRPATQDSFTSDSGTLMQEAEKAFRPSSKALEKLGSDVNLNEYRTAFKCKPKIPRTPDSSTIPSSRLSVRGSLKEAPQPQYSESGPRPSSAGKTNAPGSPRKKSSLS